jgi:uncharacterized protein with PIN domain
MLAVWPQVGNVYNNILILNNIDNTNSKCKCFCGNTFISKNCIILNGNKKSCGCLKTPNLCNKTFGLLLVLNKTSSKDGSGGILWSCKCSCGNIINTSTSSLISGNTKSCGCLLKNNFKTYRKLLGKNPNVALTDRTQQLRDVFKHSKISKIIFMRDNYTCQLCNSVGKELNAHHIIPSSINDTLLLEQSNLITLCRSCHKLAHNGGKWRTVDKEIQAKLLELV